ncbi:MAG: DNA polymerase III subunit gamma/tau [Candidatus Spechtbacterales bacterium]
MSKVLYRKYRPKTFSEVVGQEHVITTLQNAVKMDEVAHAYLFTGPRGTGKTTTARLFAKTLNCVEQKSEACAKCEVCREVDEGIFVDLIEIDAASNRGIDDIRELKEAVRFSPNKGKYKVYLIDEVHMLSKDAFNALLKTLEEPPAHVVFVLATTEPHKVLPTIISRTQRFDFRYLNTEEITTRLGDLIKRENKKLDDDVIRLVVAASGGSLRDAESILGKVLSVGNIDATKARSLLGVTDFEKIASFTGLIAELKKEEAIKFIDNLNKEGGDMRQFANNVIEYARTLLLLKLSPSSKEMLTANFTAEEAETASLGAQKLTEKQIYDIIREFITASNSVKTAPLPQLPLELAVVALCPEKDS